MRDRKMKKMIVASVIALAMIFAAGAPESDVLAAAKKRTCSCKPRLRAKTRAHASRVLSQNASTSAGVVGPVYATYTLERNQYFRLRMNQTLNSEISRVGDRFTSTVITPVYAGGVEVVPAGSIVEGRVSSVKSSRTRGREGQMALSFDTLVLPSGKRMALDGALTELQDDRSSTVDGENGVSGKPSDKRNVAYIGGGTAGGALLGGIIGGGKGAGIGAAIGAGAGVAGVFLSKGHRAEIRSGTEVGMTTNRPLTFKVRSDR
jgi:type IV secretion system protein VirB10